MQISSIVMWVNALSLIKDIISASFEFVLLSEDLSQFDSSATLVFSIYVALAEQEIFLKRARFASGKKRNAKNNK